MRMHFLKKKGEELGMGRIPDNLESKSFTALGPKKGHEELMGFY